MARLQHAYGASANTHAATLAAQQQQQQESLSNGAKAAVRQLPVLKFAQQAEFVRLVSTALSAVQVRQRKQQLPSLKMWLIHLWQRLAFATAS
jgi:hypothetical protein